MSYGSINDFSPHVFDPNWWQVILIILLITQPTILSVTLYFHRCIAHKSIVLHPSVELIFGFILWVFTGMLKKEWPPIHRKHHAKCETKDDPHSPQVWIANIKNSEALLMRGEQPYFWGVNQLYRTLLRTGFGEKVIRFLNLTYWVLWKGVRLYVLESRNKETLARYGRDITNDWVGQNSNLRFPKLAIGLASIHNWLEQNIYYRFPKTGIALTAIVDIVLFGGVTGMIIWGFQMIWIPIWAAGVINGVAHYVGYRVADTRDASRNIVPLGFFLGGEELHSGHHAYPASAKFSIEWYEYDIGWSVICFLRFFGLAKVKHLAPQKINSRTIVDEKTLAFLRYDYGYVSAFFRKLLLKRIVGELKVITDPKTILMLTELERMLRDRNWGEGSLQLFATHVKGLEKSESSIPKFAQFIDIFNDIQAKTREVGNTTGERDEQLLFNLRNWIVDIKEWSSGKGDKFVNMIVKTVLYRPKTE